MSFTRLSVVLAALFCLIGFLGPICIASKHNSTVYLESIIPNIATITNYHTKLTHKLKPNIENPPWHQIELLSSKSWSSPSEIRCDLANILSTFQKPLMTITLLESDRDVTVNAEECRRLDGAVRMLTGSFFNLNGRLHQYLPAVTEETEDAMKGIAMLQVHLKDDYLNFQEKAFRICPWTDLYENSLKKYWWQIKLALATQSVSAISGGIAILMAVWSAAKWAKQDYIQRAEERKERKKKAEAEKAARVVERTRRQANRTEGMEEGRATRG